MAMTQVDQEWQTTVRSWSILSKKHSSDIEKVRSPHGIRFGFVVSEHASMPATWRAFVLSALSASFPSRMQSMAGKITVGIRLCDAAFANTDARPIHEPSR